MTTLFRKPRRRFRCREIGGFQLLRAIYFDPRERLRLDPGSVKSLRLPPLAFHRLPVDRSNAVFAAKRVDSAGRCLALDRDAAGPPLAECRAGRPALRVLRKGSWRLSLTHLPIGRLLR